MDVVEEKQEPLLLDLIGFFEAGFGLGESVRLIHQALLKAGVRVQTINRPLEGFSKLNYATNFADFRQLSEYQPAPLALVHVNGEAMPSLARTLGGEFFQDRKIVGIWFWETANLPENAREGFAYLDEVWVCSEFVAEAVRRSAPEGFPVRVFANPLALKKLELSEPTSPSTLEGQINQARKPEQVKQTEDWLETKLGISLKQRFLFLFSFDYHSNHRRKNPDAVCEAFANAFPEPRSDGPLCLIKSINGADKHRVAKALLEQRWAHRADILFFDEFLSSEQQRELFSRANAYVSLHRAEGLGLTLMEAMAAGKPCIATAYSGNLEFMNEANSQLIPYREVPVGTGDLHYPAEEVWAEADSNSAAEAMRKCVIGGAKIQQHVEQAYTDIHARHSLLAAGNSLRELAQLSLEQEPFPDKGDNSSRSRQINTQGAVKHRRQARQSLAQLRELQQEMDELTQKRVSSKKIARWLTNFALKSRQSTEQTLKTIKQENEALQLRLEEAQRRTEVLEGLVEELILENSATHLGLQQQLDALKNQQQG